MSGETEYLFVYGTLRSDSRAESYHRFIKPRFSLVGRGTVAGRLYLITDYPGLLPARSPSDIVTGEVHAFSGGDAALLEADDYEGCGPGSPQPHLYRREHETVTLHDGTTVQAWVYFYNLPVDENRFIRSGDFLDPI